MAKVDLERAGRRETGAGSTTKPFLYCCSSSDLVVNVRRSSPFFFLSPFAVRPSGATMTEESQTHAYIRVLVIVIVIVP
jgi:hypothetical protein